MLTSLNRLTGLPVIWRDRHMGYVERAVADVRHMCLNGLVVRRGFACARWAPRETILLAGRQSVVLREKPVRMPDEEPEAIRRAFLTSGDCAGEVSDVVIHGDTLRIAALEVSQGPFYRLMGRCAYASDCRISEYGEMGDVVVPPPISWTQLLTQFGEEDEE